MILVDSSAWIEFLRRTGSPANAAVRRLVAEGRLAVTEPVVMEVLAGARDEQHLHDLRRLLGRAELVPCAAADWADAASLYRVCRQRGSTVRRLTDCLIASVAIRTTLPVLHHDRDFDALARHTPLRLHAG